jgi:hypothetical protein
MLDNVQKTKASEYLLCRFRRMPLLLHTYSQTFFTAQHVQEMPSLKEIWVPSCTNIFRSQLLKISSLFQLLRHTHTQLFSSTLCSRYFSTA